MIYSIYKATKGTQFPEGLILVQQNNETIYTKAWQPSLVLGDLGRALTGPYSLQRLLPRPTALQPTKAKEI